MSGISAPADLGASDRVGGAMLVAGSFPRRIVNTALALEQNGELECLATAYVYRAEGGLERLLNGLDRRLGTAYGAQFRRRELPGIAHQRICLAPGIELRARLRAVTLGAGQRLRNHDQRLAEIDAFAARRLRRQPFSSVFAREDCALQSFAEMAARGGRRVYDLPTAHHRRVRGILEREHQRFPGIDQEPGLAEDFAPHRLARKDREIELATHILAPSNFVRDSLLEEHVPADKITVMPSACEEGLAPPEDRAAAGSSVAKSSTAVVLHVGRLSMRKGTHRLLRAWKRLGAHRSHRLRLIGDMYLSREFLRDFKGCYEHLPRLPRNELYAHYAQARFFVLPAAAEGMSGVVLEAVARGVPVIASHNSGVEGLLSHRVEGLFHDFDDEDSLCEQLDYMLGNPQVVTDMSRACLRRAASWTWSHYRQNFLDWNQAARPAASG